MAFADSDRSSYKYQYSITEALHGFDVLAYFNSSYLGPTTPTQGPDLVKFS